MESNGKTTHTQKESQNCKFMKRNEPYTWRLSALCVNILNSTAMKQHHREIFKMLFASSCLALPLIALPCLWAWILCVWFPRRVDDFLCRLVLYSLFFSISCIEALCTIFMTLDFNAFIQKSRLAERTNERTKKKSVSAWYNLCTQCVHLNAHHLLSDLGYYPIYTDSRMYLYIFLFGSQLSSVHFCWDRSSFYIINRHRTSFCII